MELKNMGERLDGLEGVCETILQSVDKLNKRLDRIEFGNDE